MSRSAGALACALMALTLAARVASAAPARSAPAPARSASTPAAHRLPLEDVVFRAAGDSAALAGWWIPGPRRAPVLVMAGAGTGDRADLLPLAREFHDRGLALLLFDYRDRGPQGVGAPDSLRNVVLASRWVDDAVGALRYARARAGSGTCVLGWGHELGSVVMMAAAARGRRPVITEGIVIDNPFRSTDDRMRWNGTSVIPDAVTRQRQLVARRDEPFVAASSLRVPVLLMLAGKEESAPAAVAEAMFGPRQRVDRWQAPAATLADLVSAPGYVERVMQWVQDVRKWATPP